MLDAIRKLFQGETATAPGGADDGREAQVAACVLLLELAHADGEFSAQEREYIENALQRHYGLGPEEIRMLLDLAESRRGEAIDHFHFTRELTRDYDLGQKMVLAEVMWGVILADGAIAPNEAYLIRKLANLLDLEPGYLSAAKARVREAPPPG